MGETPEIVIGIDFGTTYSGVSWAINAGAKAIRLITNWPNPAGGHNPISEKVPSVIAYENGHPTKWGYTVTDRDRSLRWIKLLLEPESAYGEKAEQVRRSNKVMDELQKEPVSVVADFLRILWEYTLRDIERRQGSEFRDLYKLRVVMSVPAMWTPVAKEKTLQAAREAGLGEQVVLVTEPEAAALATLKDKTEMQELQPGDCFVVCDAGGGTVDLISYEVHQVGPLSIKECAIGNGGLCGSAYLDMEFQKWVATKIGQKQWDRLKDSAKRRMMADFEYIIKRDFDPSCQEVYSVDLRGVEDNEAEGIQDDTIVVDKSVVLAIFDNICDQVKELVAQQIDQIRARKRKRIRAILLVGGFGESGYLFEQLKDAHQKQGLSVLQVNGAWSVVCRGATLWGLEYSDPSMSLSTKTVHSRLARYSYGVALYEDYNEKKHVAADKEWDSARGTYIAGNQMRWLIKRGDELCDDQKVPLKVVQTRTGIKAWSWTAQEFRQSLLYTTISPPPTRRVDPSVKKLCEIEWKQDSIDLASKSSGFKREGVKYRDIEFVLTIVLGTAGLSFSVTYNSAVVASCTAKYPETQPMYEI